MHYPLRCLNNSVVLKWAVASSELVLTSLFDSIQTFQTVLRSAAESRLRESLKLPADWDQFS